MRGPNNSSTNRSGQRYYVWPSKKPYELEVPSVTTIIGGGIPKPALQGWAARSVAEYAVRHKDAWERLPADDAVHLLKGSPYRYTNKKANLGTIVHNAVEAYAKQEEPEEREETPLDEASKPYIAAAKWFFADHKPEILHVERTIYSRTHGYAGTSDLIAKIKIPGSRKKVYAILDYKTGKAIYPEYGVQLAVYSRGDFIAGDNDEELPFPAEIRDGVSIRLMPSGKYEARHFLLTDEMFDLFLAAKVVFDRDRVCGDAMGQRFVRGVE